MYLVLLDILMACNITQRNIDNTNIDIYDSSDVSKYLFYVINACSEYNSLFSEFDLFVKLVGEDLGF